MKRRKLLVGFAVAAVAAASVGVVGTAGAAQAHAAASAVVSGPAALSSDVAATAQGAGTDARETALRAYWTSARMRAAVPDSQLPKLRARSTAAQPVDTQAPQSGPRGRIAGAAAAKNSPAVTTGAAVPQAYYPNYPTGSPVARTYGKVFFTNSGVNYVCSGTVVNTEGKSEVWTAGHCVTDGGTWNYNWVFVPNYANGSAPYGYWYAYQLWTTSAWFNNNNDFANDVGSAVLYRNSGWRITDYLGGQGIAWNYGIGYYMYAFGYPQAPPFTGCCLVAEQGYTYDGGGNTIYMVNYMTGGSSGGAWLNWFNGNWGYINGHNDFKYVGYPQYMFSPYYGNQVASLYNAVRYIST
jgi:hypothetical protein